MKWTTENISDLTGKTILVTGANSGLGYQVSLALAAKGAQVVMTARDLAKGESAAAEIKRLHPRALVDVMQLDLASLASIKTFAASFAQRYPVLHILCNNAGVMATPQMQTTDGFELQFGTNHLGHFALTALLLPCLKRAPQARVVSVSSMMHSRGSMHFDDLNLKRGYNEWTAYSQSKLANVLFAYELQRKLTAHNLNIISVGVHPGFAATNLQVVGARLAKSSWREAMMKFANKLFAGTAEQGAIPLLYGCVAADVSGGDFFGPSRQWEPQKEKSSAASNVVADAATLWKMSEEMTGIKFEL